MTKTYEFRINSPNLWGALGDYYLYPEILKDFEEDRIYKKSELKKKLMEQWNHRLINDKKPTNRTANSGITESLFGIDIAKGERNRANKNINSRGINLFETNPYTDNVKITEEAIKLRDLYFQDKTSDAWRVKLLELFLKYDLRFRVIFLNILTYKNKLYYFNGKSLKILNKNRIYIEETQINEKIKIFEHKREKFNELFQKNQYDIVGPFLRKKALDLYNFEISETDNITIMGFRGEPSTSQNYNHLKKLITIMKDIDLIINENGNLNFNLGRFIELFDENVIKDFIMEKEIATKPKKSDDLNKFYKQFKLYCKEEIDPLDNYIPIGKIYLHVCEDLGITSEKEKKFCELFYKLNNKKYKLLGTNLGSPRRGRAPCGDPSHNKWKIDFY